MKSKSGDRAFVFDLGGVVLRWRPQEVLRRALPERVSNPETARRWAAEIFQSPAGDWLDFDRGTYDAMETALRISTRTGLTAAEMHSVIHAIPFELQPVPTVLAWMEKLRIQGRPLHFLSNMSAPFARHLEQTEFFPDLFSSGIFSSRVKLVKPDSAIFHFASQLFGRSPSNLLLIDDHLPNVEAARAAGWKAIHFVDAEDAESQSASLGW